ncbi:MULTISPECIES: nucleotidyltransferase family protein [unclassified Fibrobacter]|uniref:nucleotidyltransferase domain-containing protein n=1 Tax=unclassified Fibrobacter TaxID=2634177 RepID=UPI000D6B3EBE|nr:MULTISPECIES: nucleotidyltransferase family protein [unclassified Fibrobacter]PWJ56023.1 putative nucleotidyltransferase-like protein [Fibrobacter sp. UWR4]
MKNLKGRKSFNLMISNLFKLLQLSLSEGNADALCNGFPRLSAEEWERIYNEADRQTLLGLAFDGVMKLPQELRPPMELMFQWASEAESFSGLNKILNVEAAKLTEFFKGHGRSCAVLKGQANARLYPNPLCRQPGDIDIWVSGGKKSVVGLLRETGMQESLKASPHHTHMKNDRGIDVEVHFRTSSGNYNPFTTRRLLKYLDREILNSVEVPEGFCAHSTKFALAMQLSHIYRHFIRSGVGLRQVVDYYVLLRHSSESDRRELMANLDRFGLRKIAGALMWLLRESFGLDDGFMLCKPDEFRGRWLLREILKGGNFGRHTDGGRLKWLYWWFGKRKKSLSYWRFDLAETFWAEVNYWKIFVGNTSTRIRLRKISLRDVKF